HTRSKRDWSSDVCSSDLLDAGAGVEAEAELTLGGRKFEASVAVAVDLLHDRDPGQLDDLVGRHRHVLRSGLLHVATGFIEPAVLRRAVAVTGLVGEGQRVVDAGNGVGIVVTERASEVDVEDDHPLPTGRAKVGGGGTAVYTHRGLRA